MAADRVRTCVPARAQPGPRRTRESGWAPKVAAALVLVQLLVGCTFAGKQPGGTAGVPDPRQSAATPPVTAAATSSDTAAATAPATATGTTPASATTTAPATATGTTTATATARSSATSPDTESALPPADIAAIRTSVAEINATAGGTVAAQRATLSELVVPGSATAQSACPTATTTIELAPVYTDLRRADSAATTSSPGGSSQPPGGTEYLLPALITIYTRARITGTDLTTLRMFILDGRARTSPLCVS